MAPSKKSATKTTKWTVDAGQTAKDQVVDPAALEKFFTEKIKVDNKTGNLGSKVSVSREGYKVVVSTKDESTDKKVVSKRYIKYLTKKYLKKNEIRDYIKVNSSSKGVYELRYFKTAEDAE